MGRQTKRAGRDAVVLPEPHAAASLGVYLHLPFCLSKCYYCDFDSASLASIGGEALARRYLDALGVEMDLRAASEEFRGALVETIYLGGGTPTVLPAEWLAELIERLRKRFDFAESAEITVEANPKTVDDGKMAELLEAGVNRISLGVQSLRDDTLRTLGRAHSAAEAKEAVRIARAAGCRNLSVDLLYGVPGQSLAEWQASVREVVEVGPEHISAYGLSVEPGTPLAEAIAAGRVPEQDDELCAEMYEAAAEALTSAGYRHYEISNFARPGHECRHNRRYWAGAEYLGLGCSGHSYRRAVRWNNVAGARVYTEWLERGLLPVARTECLSAPRRVGEMLMLGLRREEGVGEEEVAAACGLAPRAVYGDEIRELCESACGGLVAEGGRLRMPRAKWIVSNEVLSCFVA